MKRIVDKINELSGQYHAHDIFQDWVTMTAIMISNQVDYDQDLENIYLSLAKKYSSEQLIEISKMSGILVELMENEISDYLGTIYMALNASSNRTGQFFTPFHLCEIMAETSLEGYDGNIIKVNEPSCGGGANILALAKSLLKRGFNYQDKMKVVAQDLDVKCVYMTYTQLSIAGINAEVIQGDTLKNECNRRLLTPMYILKGGFNYEG